MATMSAVPSSSSSSQKSESSPSTTYASKEDIAIFGSLNATIADHLTDQIETALSQGVASLPLLLNNDTAAPSLQTRLCNTFLKNVDIMELYGARNIFSISMIPPNRRAQVVKLYEKQEDDDIELDDSDDVMEASPNNVTKKQSESSSSYPISKQDIPTDDQMQQLQQETQELRHKLQQAKRRRQQYKSALEKLQVAEQLAELANTQTVESNIEKTVHESVTAAVMGMNGLENLLQTKGKALIQQMQDEKRQRDDDDDQEIDLLENKKKTKSSNLSLEERYELDRSALLSSTTTASSLGKIHETLTMKNNENAENS